MVTSSSTVVPPPPPFHNTTSTTAAAAAAAAGENTGRWTAEEHRLFLRGLELHGKGWKKIATLIQSRTVVQIRTHAQKYFQKLAKAHQLVGPHTNNNTIVTGADGQTMMMVNVVNNNNMNGSSTASSGGTTGGEGVTGFIVPLGPDGLPVVSMRTIAAGNGGGGGGDAASTTTLGMKRRHLHGSELTNTTKRRVIGNVVRSAVREGRNIKRQQIAEKKRKKNSSSSESGSGGNRNSSDDCKDIISDSEEQSVSSSVTTTLPSVSELLHPFVTSDQAPGSSSNSSNASAGKGRKQLVNTATHGMLPMAALEDAV
jgi:SHAQKYF class myb-like DNA-binding protein